MYFDKNCKNLLILPITIIFAILDQFKYICIQITFNIPLKVFFCNKKYTIKTKTNTICKSMILIEKPGLTDF